MDVVIGFPLCSQRTGTKHGHKVNGVVDREQASGKQGQEDTGRQQEEMVGKRELLTPPICC